MSYNSIVDQSEFRIEIKKSEFIGRASPAQTEAEAESFISSIKTLENRATHNCYCYSIGRQANCQRFSDDGEPSGTAGMPMLEICNQKDLRNLVIVVTRYFGGIKLGASGLIRVYRAGATGALDKAGIVRFEKFVEVRMDFPYTVLGKLDYYKNNEILFEKKRNFTDRVGLVWLIEESRLERVKSDLLEICQGDLTWEELDRHYYPEDVAKRGISAIAY